MAKYLVKASYTAGGAKGLIKEGGTSRLASVEKVVANMGGKVECFYYAFGDADVYSVLDVPDAVTVIAFSLAINATGLVDLSIVPLITPAEIDAAVKKSVNYRGPGA